MREGEREHSLGFLRGNMAVMIATGALWQFAGNAVWPFFSLYVLALGGSPEMIGIINGVGTLASILPTVVGGYFADVYGRKKLTAFFSVVLGFTSLLMAMALDWRMLLAAVVVDSLAAGFREPAMSALIADSLSPESRGIGFAAWAIIPTVPSLISPMIAGYLIDAHGTLLVLKWGYALTGIAALTAGICRYMFLRETVLPRTAGKSISTMTRTIASTHRLMSRNLWILLLGESLIWLGWSVASPYFILYGTSGSVGLTTTEWGIVLLVSSSARVLGFALGSLADRYGRRNMTIATLLLASASSFFFLQSKTLSQVALVFTIYSVSILVAQQLSQALRADVCPRENRSRVYSFFIIWQYITRTVGSVLGGFLYVSVSMSMPFHFQALAALVCAVILVSSMAETARRQK
mgnify:CR=1 FL=1